MPLSAAVDPGAVGLAGVISVIFTAIAIPLWRTFIKKQETENDKATGEAGWLKRQATELNKQDQLITELLKLRQLDAEVIASLRLEKALAAERTERLLLRMRRMEEVLCKIKPEFAKWIRSDFAEFVVYDPELPSQESKQ